MAADARRFVVCIGFPHAPDLKEFDGGEFYSYENSSSLFVDTGGRPPPEVETHTVDRILATAVRGTFIEKLFAVKAVSQNLYRDRRCRDASSLAADTVAAITRVAPIIREACGGKPQATYREFQWNLLKSAISTNLRAALAGIRHGLPLIVWGSSNWLPVHFKEVTQAARGAGYSVEYVVYHFSWEDTLAWNLCRYWETGIYIPVATLKVMYDGIDRVRSFLDKNGLKYRVSGEEPAAE